MSSRDLKKEFDILKKYFNYLKNVKVNLIVFSNEIIAEKEFQIINSNWNALNQYLKNVIYDGATNYDTLSSKIKNSKSESTLFFTDLMTNLNTKKIAFNQPAFILNSIAKSNHLYANKILNNNNGAYINLNNINSSEALDMLIYKKYELLEIITDNPKTEIYPKKIKNLTNGINFSGKNIKNNQKITLKFGLNNKVLKTITYTIPNKKISNPKIKKLFAQKKINYLQLNKEKNKEAIIKISKENNIISDFTSLIVLDNVRDYIKYNITPPSDLLDEYNRIKKTNNPITIHTTEQITQEPENIQGEFIVSGTVYDDLGHVADISVAVKGTNQGTVTDFDGNYSIPAKIGDDLVFSHVSYGTVETTVAGRKMNIRLNESGNSLEEVVITAMGVSREKKSMGYTITKIYKEEINQQNYPNLASMLQGKVAGVQVTGNTSSSVRIRGGNKPPLYVLDGIPVSNVDEILNLNNIESLTVVKGVSATTRYGSQASNGAVIITSKRPETTNYYNNSGNYEQNNKTPKYTGSLNVNYPKNKAEYLKAYKKLKSKNEYYTLYLKQKETYAKYPAFFVDVYDIFTKKGFNNLANRILSNYIELKINDYEALKIYAYKLEKAKNYPLAVFIHKQILKTRPEDAQSYRDLALAYQNNGNFNQAVELLDSIVSGKIYKNTHRRNFKGINQIAKTEILNLTSNELITNKKIAKKYKKYEFFDIRVVIDWNHNDTDIDLHIIDPNLEECYYSHPKTKIGGRLSQDMTQGFGPEEYTLKKAIKGNYFVKINYYGDRYQKIENPTFIKVTIFKKYGSTEETKEVKVIRLSGKKDNYILAKIKV